MKEVKFDSLNLSSVKNTSFPTSGEKMKKSKIFHNKIARKFIYNHKKSPKEKNKTINKKFYDLYTINSQLQKHNSNPLKKNIMIINDIIGTKTNHFLAIFKDYLITDYIDEFLKRYFLINECKELLPRFYEYYRNYLKFFCRGIFTDFQLNKIVQEYGELQAELYYNKNYGDKEKKEKNNKNENYNARKKISKNNTNMNIKKLFFTEKIRNSISKIENSKLINNYIYKFNTNEISNIYYKNKNETITLNEDTKIYNNDNLISKENSIVKIVDAMIHKKAEKKKSKKDIKIMNDKNIINIYKNLLNQSPIKSQRMFNNYNKKIVTTKKVSSIKIFNKNIPSFKNYKSNFVINNKIKNMIKTPKFNGIQKILLNNYKTRNYNNNINNIFMKSNLTQKGYYRNSTSKLDGVGKNLVILKNNNNKLSSFNTNVNINSHNSHSKKKKKLKVIKSRNIDTIILSISSSRNLKKNSFEVTNLNKNTKTNNQRLSNRIQHYKYINYKNLNQLKSKNKSNSNNKYKQNNSTSKSNSNSIFNNFHININNNIMLLNNNITHYNSSKNYLKSNPKSKKNQNIKLISNKQHKSRNYRNGFGIGIDLKKYKTEIKSIYNINKSNKNICSSFRRYIYLVKSKNKSKDKISKNKEILIRNKSNVYNNHSCFKIKKLEDSDNMPSFRNKTKINDSNKNLYSNKTHKKIIFDYKRK